MNKRNDGAPPDESIPRTTKRIRIFSTSSPLSNVTHENQSERNSSISVQTVFSRVFQDITNLPRARPHSAETTPQRQLPSSSNFVRQSV
ncbi:hypothetical protein CARUB_v10007947mg [Capsella rubella]|uniref:Uncharacterized protein n=1 Tax=Capsella rubella TaxID=81985 RepID=R0GJ38_9BRAS|nr:hypothetical protein CARUB_v10007947mg [Capsella rubella]